MKYFIDKIVIWFLKVLRRGNLEYYIVSYVKC